MTNLSTPTAANPDLARLGLGQRMRGAHNDSASLGSGLRRRRRRELVDHRVRVLEERVSVERVDEDVLE